MGQSYILDASVIIPVYNQVDSLRIVLESFKKQRYSPEKYEIIIVDDGSTDNILSRISENSCPQPECAVKWIHQENKGRAAARNAGAALARGAYLIFCDADRFSEEDFVGKYIKAVTSKDNIAAIGCPWDYFGNMKSITLNDNFDWSSIKKYARKSQYYLKISNIFDLDGYTDSRIGWAAFLIGNACVKKEDFINAGGFDPDFKLWGFEHFELGFRLQKNNIKFLNCSEIGNYHIPHSRSAGYYKSMIQDSAKLMKRKHPQFNFDCLEKFLFGEISLQDFEKSFCGKVSWHLQNKEPVFYKTKL